MSLVAGTVRMDLSFVCTICFLLTAHCLDPPLSRKCASPSEHGLGVSRDSVHLLTCVPPLFFSCLESYGPGSSDNVRSVPRLAFRPKGDILTVIEQNTGGLEGWWLCSLTRPGQGIVPGLAGEASDWPSAGDLLQSGPAHFGTGATFLWPTNSIKYQTHRNAPRDTIYQCRLPTKIREFTKSPTV